ncbi:MAG: hypoxanthine phosphoribosyltransferase [Bacteroidota bacterium]
MKEVRVHDKNFVEIITQEEIFARIADLAGRLNRDYPGDPPILVPILNGAFMFAADLLRALAFDPEVRFMRLSSYGEEMSSSGKIKNLLDLQDIDGREVLIIEDIVDTGNTLHWLREHLSAKGAQSVKMAALLFKHEMFEYEAPPEYYCFRIPTEFVIGYGLDYAERGRSLKSIYKLKD